MKLLKKVTSVVLSLVICFSFSSLFACSNSTTNDNSDKDNKINVNVWTASGTEKILRDIDYSSRYSEKNLEYNLCKNEKESAQIIISGNVGQKYDIELSDLTSPNGDVLSKSDFTVYNEKYVEVTKLVNTKANVVSGYYPDALLPFETAVSYGENILSGLNQGIWLTLKTSDSQPAGVYSGNFTIQVDSDSFSVAVSVYLYDYTLSNVTHSKSSFTLNAEEIAWGELDSTEEMFVNYYEYLLDYRISAEHLPGNDLTYVVLKDGSSELEKFLYYAEKYSRDERMSSYNIPFNVISVKADVYNDGNIITVLSVDFDLFKETLIAMANRSVESGIDIIKKAGTYFCFFDEYDRTGLTDTAVYNLNMAYDTCKDVYDTLKDDNSFCSDNAELRDSILNSILYLKHKVVGTLSDELADNVKTGQSIPTIDKYNSESVRKEYSDFDYDMYGENGELWTYTCTSPHAPNPTYHIDDVLLSSRLYGWMMYNYNIVGNLYWDVALYAYRKGAGGINYQLQDYYSKALHYYDANGDGYLLYPGRPYGINGPVGSVRLSSICDANEDYDLLWALENDYYSPRGVTGDKFDELIETLTQSLYYGTNVKINDNLVDNFNYSRKTLLQLLSSAKNCGFVIESIDKENSKANIICSALSDVVLKMNNAQLTPYATNDGISSYKISVDLTETSNYLNLTCSKGGNEYDISLFVGGKSLNINASNYLQNASIFNQTAGISTTKIDDINVLKFDIESSTEAVSNNYITEISGFDSLSINNVFSAVKVKLYFYGQSGTLQITAKGTNVSSYSVAINSYSVVSGWNEISFNVSSLPFTATGYVSAMRFYFLSDGTGLSFAIGDITFAG